MFKRIAAFFTVLFMGLVLTVRSPVKADTFSIPFSAIPDLLNAFYTVAAGGKIEFSALVGDITGVDDFLEGLNNYYTEHYTNPLLQNTQNLINIGISGLAMNGINSLDQINSLTIPISIQDIGNFMGYDINWVDRYADSNDIVENPDVYFQSYIDQINHSNLTYNNINFNASISNHRYSFYDTYGTLFCGNGNISNSNTVVFTQTFQDIIDINIVDYNGSYSYYIPALTTLRNNWWYNPQGWYSQLGNWTKTDNYVVGGNLTAGFGTSTTGTFPTYSFNGTLEQCFIDIANHFVNANIFVNGNLWSFAGSIPNPAISLNDSIAVGDTGTITYGIYPLTSTGDIGLDLAKWGEYIFNKCISGVDSLSMDTVIDDGWDLVDTEDGERAITQDDEEDVAKVIHGFVGTTATTPTPTPDIGDPPVLKIIPPVLELPDEIWPDGGRDTTVLAQMVHATDVAIPNDIMTIIWSTIGLLVVGGLISILHK